MPVAQYVSLISVLSQQDNWVVQLLTLSWNAETRLSGGEDTCISLVAAQGGTVEMDVLVWTSLLGVFGALSSCTKLAFSLLSLLMHLTGRAAVWIRHWLCFRAEHSMVPVHWWEWVSSPSLLIPCLVSPPGCDLCLCLKWEAEEKLRLLTTRSKSIRIRVVKFAEDSLHPAVMIFVIIQMLIFMVRQMWGQQINMLHGKLSKWIFQIKALCRRGTKNN